jgi:ribosomal protein L35
MKTNKAFSKRIRVTRKGKLVARRPGQDHYNALESGREKHHKGGMQGLSVTTAVMRRFLPGNGGKKRSPQQVAERASDLAATAATSATAAAKTASATSAA